MSFSVKPRRQDQKVFTLRDAREEKLLMNARAEHCSALREARAKVAHWEKKVALYGGEIQRETLARMRANLAKLEA